MKQKRQALLILAISLAAGIGCKPPRDSADDIDWNNVQSVTTDSKDPKDQYIVKSFQMELDKNWAGLLQAADDWLATHPDSGEALSYKGIAEDALGHPELGVIALRRSVEILPDIWPTWSELGEALEATGDAQGAADARAKAADLKKKEEETR